jgi:transcription-repair coupling factor (superfamily II helicase)
VKTEPDRDLLPDRRRDRTFSRDHGGGQDSLGEIDLLEGTLARGFCFPAANLVVLAAAELFGRAPTHGRRRLQRATKFGTHRAQIDFSELNEGELVVHLEHGIGRFLGLQRMGGPETGEVLAIEFAEEAKLFVPLEQAFMVSRYVGIGKKSPPLSSLADAKWTRAKKNAVPRFSITRAKCSHCKPSARRSAAMPSEPTPNGN